MVADRFACFNETGNEPASVAGAVFGAGAMPHDARRPKSEVPLELLVRELQHRIRNLLTVVQCFVVNTEASSADSYRDALSARIVSLSDAYALVESAYEHRVSLMTLLERTLQPHATMPCDRVVLAGPDITLEPRLALSLHMIFHELATNASKHGALISKSGSVEVLWDSVPGLADRSLAIQWRERGGPIVKDPCRKGFGMRLISSALSGARIDTEFAPSGLICRLLIEMESFE